MENFKEIIQQFKPTFHSSIDFRRLLDNGKDFLFNYEKGDAKSGFVKEYFTSEEPVIPEDVNFCEEYSETYNLRNGKDASLSNLEIVVNSKGSLNGTSFEHHHVRYHLENVERYVLDRYGKDYWNDKVENSDINRRELNSEPENLTA